jgi:hypothetical protein
MNWVTLAIGVMGLAASAANAAVAFRHIGDDRRRFTHLHRRIARLENGNGSGQGSP